MLTSLGFPDIVFVVSVLCCIGCDKTTKKVPPMKNQPVLASPVKALSGHSGYVFSVAFSPDGKTLVSAGAHGEVLVWNWREKEITARLSGHRESVYSVSFSRDSRFVVTGSWDKTVRVWDSSTWKLQHVLTGEPPSKIVSTAVSPDSRFVAIGANGREEVIEVWDIAKKKIISVLRHPGLSAHCVTFSPDGAIVASVSDDATARLWSLAEKKEIGVLKGHSRDLLAITFSPDGKLLATGAADRTVKIWDVAQCKELSSLGQPDDEVNCLAFSPRGDILVVGCGGSPEQPGIVTVWDVNKAAKIDQFVAHSGSVRSVSVCPNGRLFATGGEDGVVRVWEMPVDRKK